MIEDVRMGAGSHSTLGESGMRRPYLKPCVQNLDVVQTEGGKESGFIETIVSNTFGTGIPVGSS